MIHQLISRPATYLGERGAHLKEENATNLPNHLKSKHTEISQSVANTAVMSTLAPLTLDIISAPVCRLTLNASIGSLTSGKRNRMSKNLYKRVFLKMNSKYYQVHACTVLAQSVEC